MVNLNHNTLPYPFGSYILSWLLLTVLAFAQTKKTDSLTHHGATNACCRY